MDIPITEAVRTESPVPKRKVPSVDGEVRDSRIAQEADSDPKCNRKVPRRNAPELGLPELKANECELNIDIFSMMAELDDLDRDRSQEVTRVERASNRSHDGRLEFELVAYLSKQAESGYHLGLYIRAIAPECAQGREWSMRGVSFMVMLISAEEPFSDKSKVSSDCCSLSSKDPCRGWPRVASFATIEELQEQGFLTEASTVLARGQASFEGSAVVPSPAPKYLGLENQGATCYLNGLLQSLFHIGKLREIVYSESEEESSVLSALQTVFFELDENPRRVTAGSSEPLTQAFGWSSADVGVQQDVQEMNRLLIDRLETRLATMGKNEALKSLFCGKIENFISCTEIDFQSVRQEDFYDLQLSLVKFSDEGKRVQLKSVEEAIDALLAVEVLEGANAYDAGENRGKQRAEKGLRFISLPPVLTLQLMRFQFDFETLEMAKIFAKFEFPDRLQLQGTDYRLFSVLVHSGNVHGGHYYAFIRPYEADSSGAPTEQWFRFDDSVVEPVDAWSAVANNFGGPVVDRCLNYLHRDAKRDDADKPYSAYMLMYVSDSRWAEILTPVRLDDVNPNLRPALVERCKQIAPPPSRSSRRVSVASAHPVEVRVLSDDSSALFNKPVARLSDFTDPAWFQPDASSITVNGHDSIGDLVSTIGILTAPTFVIANSAGKLRLVELNLADPDLLEESVERLHSAVAGEVRNSPVIFWSPKDVQKRASGLIFVVLKFDPRSHQLAFDQLLVTDPEEPADRIAEYVQQQLGPDAQYSVFTLSSGTELVPLNDSDIEDGLFVVYQEVVSGFDDAKIVFDRALNAIDLNLIVHDFRQRKWLLGDVAAEARALDPLNKGDEAEYRPHHISLPSFDRRRPMTDLAGLVADEASVHMFADDPFDSEVRAGPNVGLPELAIESAIDLHGNSGTIHCAVIANQDKFTAGTRPILVRAFNEHVIETGCCIVHCSPEHSVSDLIASAMRKLSLPLHVPHRLVEVDSDECEIVSVFGSDSQVPVGTLLSWGANNVFLNPVRIEPVDVNDQQLTRCFHLDRSTRSPFGHPFLLNALPDQLTEDELRTEVASKLDVPLTLVRSWRLTVLDGKLMITHAVKPRSRAGTMSAKQLFIKE